MPSIGSRSLISLSLAVILVATASRIAHAQTEATTAVVALRADPEAVLELEPWRTRWTLRADVGGATRRLLLDTGGGITLISSATAKAAGCVPWGRRTGYNMFGKRFEGPTCGGVTVNIGGRRYVPAVTSLVNMAALNPADSALDGIAALDLFDGRTTRSLVGLDSAVAVRQVADFAVADGVRVHTADAFTPDLIMDGNLGLPFLRHWVITLDLQAGTAWIAPAGA